MSEWISVDELLPEKSEDNILVYFDDGEFTVGEFEKGPNGTGEWHYFCEFTGEITHWMPLPDPPKKPEVQFNTKQEG